LADYKRHDIAVLAIVISIPLMKITVVIQLTIISYFLLLEFIFDKFMIQVKSKNFFYLSSSKKENVKR